MLAAVMRCHFLAPVGVMLINTSGRPCSKSWRASLTTSPATGAWPPTVLRIAFNWRYSCLSAGLILGFTSQSKARVGGRMALASGERRIWFMRAVSRTFTPKVPSWPGIVNRRASTLPPLLIAAAESAFALPVGVFLASCAANEVVSPLVAAGVAAVPAAGVVEAAFAAVSLAVRAWSSWARKGTTSFCGYTSQNSSLAWPCSSLRTRSGLSTPGNSIWRRPVPFTR